MINKIIYIYNIWNNNKDTTYYNDINFLNLKCLSYSIGHTDCEKDREKYIHSLSNLCNVDLRIKNLIDNLYEKYYDFFGENFFVSEPKLLGNQSRGTTNNASIINKTNNTEIIMPNELKKQKNTFTENNKKKSRHISEGIKKQVAGKQKYKCANNGSNNVKGIEGYLCPYWQNGDGSFDESGYEIDHIEEFSLTQNNNINNLQALCRSCHAVKTKRFMIKYI